MEVFNFIEVDNAPAKKANSYEADLPPSWFSPVSPQTTHTRWQVSVLSKSEHVSEQRGAARPEGKVRQSDVALLTGNIRQRRPLQINVQQVLGV